jgi:3-oxoacyl-[acyl-carrier protein] reductase
VALARRGAKVIVNYVSREDAARETAELIAQAGGTAALAKFDVADGAAVKEGITQIGKDHGGLAILVNNAGIALNGLLLRFKDDDWSRTLQTNLTGAFQCSRAAAGLLLKAKDKGRIINMSSVVGEMGNAGQAAYSAAKAGLIGLTLSMAKELAPRGVTVNAIAPGFIETDMTAEHLPEAQRAKLLEGIPLGRIGLPAEIGDMVAFLAGPEAAYVTGQVLRVNGGLLM